MLVILGGGYTGRFIYTQAIRQGLSVLVTSRTPAAHLDFAAPLHRLQFDLDREDTWRNIPTDVDLIWCFPAMPLESISAFAETVLRHARRIIVLGSASAYALSSTDSDAVLDESASIDTTRPRVVGEEYLRTHAHAIVLRVAGIYGPGRNVLDWIRRGKVGASQRYVNLVHVEDLTAICLLALQQGQPGAVYNVSDGHPRRWSQICEEAQKRWGVVPLKDDLDPRTGKRLSIDKITRDLRYRFQHPDLYHALETIESSTSSRPPGAPTA
ncbi:MAG TPA: NAD-dependent epimerase/dehydratase family protein [Nitrospiraceae bacterium]|nr:NAD-dependent epimerase/dehydratase family protein [Nitrospiraceae bacterium]